MEMKRCRGRGFRSAWLVICCLMTVLPGIGQAAASAAAVPNIIVILADDLGYGDIGSFGAELIDTPHIDQLAADGIRFTQFYAASAICTQSRAGLLTGRYSVRMGIKGVFMHDSHDGMSTSEITIAEQLKKVGYHTGMVGKWHLGHLDRYMPWNQGFDEFYGVPYSNDMANFFFYENQEIIYEPIDQRYLTRRYTDKATDYIERHADQPFFLYLAHNMPHVPLYVSPEFEGTSRRGLYGDVVKELDWSAGQLVAKLRELDLLDNTIIVFTSDNGPWLAMGDHGGSAGLLRDGKITAFEGGQRVPTVLHWPAQIKRGRVDNSPASAVDLLPTFSALAGVPLPDDRVIDGEDISRVLTGEGERAHHQFYYMAPYSDTVAAYRDGDWKLKLPRSGYPKILDVILRLNTYSHGLLLFNLKNDPYERNNLAGEHPERAARMQQAIADLEASIAAEEPRTLYMKATDVDHKGYGPLMVRAALTALLALLITIAVLYGVYRLIIASKATASDYAVKQLQSGRL
jgi:arylsulfatase A